MKRIISIILVLILCSSVSFADNSLKVDLDGKVSTIDKGITWVPAKEMFKLLGAKVEWNEAKGDFTAVKGDNRISFNVDSYYMIVNGSKIYIGEDFKIIDDEVFVPLEVITKSMNVEIQVDNKLYVKSEKALEKEYKENKRRLFSEYPKLYKAIEEIMENPFERSTSISMRIVNWETEDNEYAKKIGEAIKDIGIDINVDLKMDYSKKKLDSHAVVNMKDMDYEKEKEFKIVVLDGMVYTKTDIVWTGTELTEDIYFDNKEYAQAMKQLVKYKDNIKKRKVKSDTTYDIKFDDVVYLDDFISVLGEENARLGEIKDIERNSDVKVKNFKWKYTLDKEGNLKKNDLSAILEISHEYSSEAMELLVTLESEYKNIGKPFEITIPMGGNEESKKPIDLKNLVIKKDGKEVSLDLEGIIVNGKILAPVQKVAELLDAKASVDEASGNIRLEKNNNYILINEYDQRCIVNGFNKFMPVKLHKKDEVNYIPLSFFTVQLDGIAIVDSEKSELNILTEEALKKDFEEGQKELEKKHPKLYKAIDKLVNQPYKQTSTFAYKIDSVENLGDLGSEEYDKIQADIGFIALHSSKQHIEDEIDVKNKIKKSYSETIANSDFSYVNKSEYIVIDKKLYYKSHYSDKNEGSWLEYTLENDDIYFEKLSDIMNIFRKNIVEEKAEGGTLFTVKVDSNYENKAALKRFINYFEHLIAYHRYSVDNSNLKNLEIKYLVDENGDIKTREIMCLIQCADERIRMNLDVEMKAEFNEIGKPLEIEAPVNIKK